MGAGILSCPDCGTPLPVHYWPITVIILLWGWVKKIYSSRIVDLVRVYKQEFSVHEKIDR